MKTINMKIGNYQEITIMVEPFEDDDYIVLDILLKQGDHTFNATGFKDLFDINYIVKKGIEI